ncbi:hypothetical protein ANN_01867 [Periplaneta americana]|uniref:Per a allergen n=1 Tax=Periplaneta americana TaxID=6978 RepID=A0ABQ8TVV6_PERAM|nr:hypothetical protein ANN_01867 [Periplaneta americana]
MRPRIRHILPDIRLMVGENLRKTLPGNQPKRDSNPLPNATLDRQASALGYVHVGATITDKGSSDAISERIEACIAIEVCILERSVSRHDKKEVLGVMIVRPDLCDPAASSDEQLALGLTFAGAKIPESS